jgi:hypothetical protein
MRSLRETFTLTTLGVTLALACGSKDATPTPTPTPTAGKAPAKVDHADIDPKHDPAAMGDGGERVAVTAKGSMEASLNGVVTKLAFMPPGANAAIVKPDKKIARVKIGGAASDRGLPMLELTLDGVHLHELKLPATLTIAAGEAEPMARIQYSVTEQKVWESVPGGTITIDSYSGSRVQGSFAAMLEPRSPAFGPAIEVKNGRFDVELRLNGATPGP